MRPAFRVTFMDINMAYITLPCNASFHLLIVLISAMLGGGLILICAIPVAHLKATPDERPKRLSEDSLSDPFVVGFSPDLTSKYNPGIAQSPEPALYIKSESRDEKFSRSSVEAAPDSLLTPSFTPPGLRKSLPLTRSSLAVSPFYRGNIESGALHYQGPTQYSHKSEPLRFYGAAKWQNAEPVVSTVPHSKVPKFSPHLEGV